MGSYVGASFRSLIIARHSVGEHMRQACTTRDRMSHATPLTPRILCCRSDAIARIFTTITGEVVATFVVVRVPAGDRFGNSPPLLTARMQPRSLELTSDYELFDINQGRTVAHLVAYPRCTECAMALFLRLLLRAESNVLSQEFHEELAIDVLVGESLKRVQTCEALRIRRSATSVTVALVSPDALVAGILVNVKDRASARSVVCASLMEALQWHDTPAAFPCSLMDVHIRKGLGRSRYVRLGDFPRLTAQRLRAYFGLSLYEERIDVRLWKIFVRRLSPRPVRQRGANLAGNDSDL